MTKKITIVAIVFAAAIAFWVAAEPWIYSSTKFSRPVVWTLPLVALVFLSTTVCLALTLIPEKWLKNLVFVAVALPSFVVFGLTWFLLTALAINFLFHLAAIKRIDIEKTGRLKISPMNIARKGLTFVIMPLLISVSFAYYLTPSVQESVNTHELPQSVNKVVQKTVNGVLESEINEFPASEKERVKSTVANL